MEQGLHFVGALVTVGGGRGGKWGRFSSWDEWGPQHTCPSNRGVALCDSNDAKDTGPGAFTPHR